ncbi:MAG: hypothetical protein S4CHLAM20_04380 [Chlamydiia bacterium]|nr:hypothetical protein [Chlamydiia bacterium]
MSQEVKIIGLKVNEQFGILQSFDCKFNQENNIIAIKARVGEGKTTLQKSLKLGTQGSEALKDDKLLYGKVDQEVELLDGNTRIFVGSKTDSNGKLDYSIYTKDESGKKIKEPIIDGVKATPSSYLKSLQTALNWRMNELTSENFTTQRNILLELYSDQLEQFGVIFDKANVLYGESILGRLDKAIQSRTEADVLRKQVGGYKHILMDQGIDVDNESTIPKSINIQDSLSQEQKLIFNISNSSEGAENRKTDDLRKISLQKDELLQKLREYNLEVDGFNNSERQKVAENVSSTKIIRDKLNEIYTNVKFLTSKGVFDNEEILIETFKSAAVLPGEYVPTVKNKIDLDNLIVEKEELPPHILSVFNEYVSLNSVYKETQNKTYETDVDSLKSELDTLRRQIAEDREVNKTVASVQSFIKWKGCEKQVQEIRKEYAELLKNVNTGVSGLKICFDESDEKMNIYLAYNGEYDSDYFNNPGLELRKLSSYSGTQKPMICLLVQNYLLGLKEKSMRYIWIDDVPIDNKTRSLLNEMAEKLNLTVIINITGDFTQESLDSGDIFIEGGEVFFN